MITSDGRVLPFYPPLQVHSDKKCDSHNREVLCLHPVVMDVYKQADKQKFAGQIILNGQKDYYQVFKMGLTE